MASVCESFLWEEPCGVQVVSPRALPVLIPTELTGDFRRMTMRKIILFARALAKSVFCTSNDTRITNYGNPPKALLVIDMQVDLVDENGKFPIEKNQINGLITTVNAIIEGFYNDECIIIYIRNILKKWNIAGPFIKYATREGTPGAEIDPRINIVSVNIFDKYKGSALSNEKLNNFLMQNHVDELYLCGIMADGCVYNTALDAFDRNYKVNYFSNAVGAKSTENIEKAIKILNKKGINIIEFNPVENSGHDARNGAKS